VTPPFKEYHLVDVDESRVEELRRLTADRLDVTVYGGDCNKILVSEIFPKIQFDQYKRGLCILDPYCLQLNWQVVATAAQSKTIEIFLNFPVLDMNRNVLWRRDGASQEKVSQMNAFWGDESWRDVAYRTDLNLFGEPEKQPNEVIAEAFRERLHKVAGFAFVPEPAPMRNSRGAIVYYLFFAAQQKTADKIVNDIFTAYRKRGVLHG
jgi:three-Cys-motif partner protein